MARLSLSLMASKIEFAVQMPDESIVRAIHNKLDDVHGIYEFEVNPITGSVVVETTLTTDKVMKLIESTGCRAIVKGSGSFAAVAVIDNVGNVHGVVRFMQLDYNTCIIDGTLDGLKPMTYTVGVHECGDMSSGCDSVGALYVPEEAVIKNPGVLGCVTPTRDGRASFRFTNSTLHLSDIIGRSLVIAETNGNVKEDIKVACAVIARSAGLFQNPKTVCACDGSSIWDETEPHNNSSSSSM